MILLPHRTPNLALRSSGHLRRAAVSTLSAAALVSLTATPHALAETTVVAKGAGFGHGIGMSQYGAYGQAKAGRTADQILTHYYSGTVIAKGDTARTVRVLLRTSSSVRVTGAASLVSTSRKLSPDATYVIKRSGSTAILTSSSGKKIASAPNAIRVAAPSGGAIQVVGSALNGVTSGRYRGAIELRGSQVINQLTLDEYVRGVVAGESPASWPAAALQAQAIAARTYAITTAKATDFDHYPDTRSQVYRGVTGETATTDAAVAATAGKFVTYKGKPITTYFFSTSGGRTENVENSFIGATPVPYLKSVDDPWDKASPKFRWQIRYTRSSLQRKLGGWVKGSLKSIDIIKRGVSPRVVRADIVGSKGRTSVTGPQLRSRLGLNDTWVQFVFSGATTKPLPKAPAADPPAKGGTPGGEGGVATSVARTVLGVPTIGPGILSQVIAKPPGYGVARGRVWPEGGGTTVKLQSQVDGRWRTQIRVTADATGRWTSLLPLGTRYRVVGLGVAGPTVRAE